MNGGLLRDPSGRYLRAFVIVVLVAAPLAFGSVHEPASGPLLVACSLAGLVSWARGHRSRALGVEVPRVPGRGLLLGLHLLVLFQLLPLPPEVLKRLSPGSHAFYNDRLLLPVSTWRPISVSPPDTLHGLCFLAGFTLLYAAVFREFGEERSRRQLARAVVLTGVLMTVIALVQAASPDPHRIYGLWKPAFYWAVFGPYVNRNHFAGYLVMAIPLAVAFAVEALQSLGRVWGRRRVKWLALGGGEANDFVRRSAEAMVLLVGLFASGSRGGLLGLLGAALAVPFAGRRRRVAVAVATLAVVLGVAWVGVGGLVKAFESRGIQGSRFDLWADMLPLFPSFPVFGVGMNAFAAAYPTYQTVWRTEWIGEAHDDYLQTLLDLGLLGVALVFPLLARLFRHAAARASRSPLSLGLLGSLLGLAAHALVDFNWQIPANAATYVSLAGLALAGEGPLETSTRRS